MKKTIYKIYDQEGAWLPELMVCQNGWIWRKTFNEAELLLERKLDEFTIVFDPTLAQEETKKA